MARGKPLFGSDGDDLFTFIGDQETRMLYIQRLPKAGEMAPDEVIVHNHVRPRRVIGDNGFRVWLQRITERIEPCDCGWAKRSHYRVR